MKNKFLTRINALIVLLLGALGIGGCKTMPEAKYGPPPERKPKQASYSEDIEELYGIPMPPEEKTAEK